MDFTPDPAQQAVADVVNSVLDRENSWEALVSGGVPALGVPERLGGDGVGLPEITTALTEIGRHGTVSPALATLGFGVLPLLDMASEAQQDRFLDGVAKGAILTAALNEPGAALPERPATRLAGGRLNGVKVAASAMPRKRTGCWSVPTAGVVVVSPKADGVRLTKTPNSAGGEEYAVEFSDVAVEADAVLDGATVHRLNQLMLAAIGAFAAGLVAGAVRLTADYVTNRHQFGRPLATFQTVAAQLAEVYIASRTLGLGVDLGGLAAGRRPRRRRGSRRPGLLADVEGAAGDADLPSSAWRDGYGHHLSHAPVLLVDQGSDPPAGRPGISSRFGWSAMYIELTPEQRHLQAELRQYFSTLISTDEAKEMEVDRHGKAYRAMIKRMGSDGKLGVGWPKEYGGHGFGPIEQQIFVNEAARADVPLPAVTLQTVGPTLMVYGTEVQKKKFLPAILAGEVHFAIGYSEPEAGTDLAALRTSAVRHGDEYIVNGQKIWTTGGHDADYVWLACRTDPEAAKHKGISILIVDTTDPGYSWTPIILSDGAHHTNATYYNDVRVPVDMLVGEENAGWRLITTQLNHERVMLGPAGKIAGLYDRVHAWASKPGGRRRDPDRPRGRPPRPRRDQGDLADQRAAQLAGRRGRRDRRHRGCRRHQGVLHRAHPADRPARRGDRRQVRQPGRGRDRRVAGLAGFADQAQPGDHLRRRRQRGDARAGRGCGARRAEGSAVSAVEDIQQGSREDQGIEGKSKPRKGRHAVNQPMVDHWLDAIGDKNPIYVDDAAAKAAGHPGVVAPPAMIQVWTMAGLGGVRADDDPLGRILGLFDEAGYIGVVATNCEQTYHRYLRPGEQVSVSAELTDVVGPKTTALGEGFFITQKITWSVGNEDVADMMWRIMKFRPADTPAAAGTLSRCPRTSTRS